MPLSKLNRHPRPRPANSATRRVVLVCRCQVRKSRAALGSCPSEEELAAFIDEALEIRPVLKHVAGCPNCLEIVCGVLKFLSEDLGPTLWKRLGLSVRVANALGRAGILTWEDLRRTERGFTPGIGPAALREIAAMIERYPHGEPDDAFSSSHCGCHSIQGEASTCEALPQAVS